MMTQQIEITSPLPLLTERGQLTQAGWARFPYWQFNAAWVQQPRQLRQWDFFTVMDQRSALSLTLADLHFGGFAAAELMDLQNRQHVVNLRPFKVLQSLALSSAPPGAARWQGQHGEYIAFEQHQQGMTLRFYLRQKALLLPAMHGKVHIVWPQAHESLNCVLPLPKTAGGFFYECKAPALAAQGTVVVGHRRYDFAAGQAFAVMDWGRGVWPSKVFWRWGSVTFICNGHTIGLNLGDGFGDVSAAGENIAIVNGRAHKLGCVEWRLDRKNYLAPWQFIAPDHCLSLTFEPVYDQQSNFNLLVKGIRAHRVWGRFRGQLCLEDGSVLQLPPSPGFAEEVWIKW